MTFIRFHDEALSITSLRTGCIGSEACTVIGCGVFVILSGLNFVSNRRASASTKQPRHSGDNGISIIHSGARPSLVPSTLAQLARLSQHRAGRLRA
jgi:hypothetical protein